MESGNTYWNDRALLEWQIEIGADEAIFEAPVNRYELEAKAPKPAPKVDKNARPPIPEQVKVDAPAVAETTAQAAPDIAALAIALQAFPYCDLKQGARNFVFADGTPDARVMIIGEAPNRDEDRDGKPFIGPMGDLLTKMLAAIDLSRTGDTGVYTTNVLPWRPPADRPANKEEIEMLAPFLKRHITLANPDVLILFGATPCQALLGRSGMTRIRGQWQDVLGRPAIPMFHPAHLLRQPAAKRDAWADLLALKAKLKQLS